MMKKVDVKGSMDPLTKASTLFATISRFNFASKYSLEIGKRPTLRIIMTREF